MLSAADIAARVRSGEYDPVDITEEALARLAARDPDLHACLDVDAERARVLAEQVGDRLRRGEDPGRLAGVPVSLKDNIAVEGATLTAGSRLLEGYRAPATSHVARRLLDEGAVLLGRTNLDEFAMGSSTEHSAFGPTRNPWDPERVPGGSSGGSAAAVAAGIVPVALGSETGGSIRQPAALCGVTGFKPSYGAVSRRGLLAFGSSLDQIGPLTANAEDAALVHDVLSGHDPGDATSRAGERLSALVERADLEGLRIGVPADALDDVVDKQVKERVNDALALLEDGGALVKGIPRERLPTLPHALSVYYLVACCEASSNLARFDGLRYGRRAGEAEAAATELDALLAETRGELLGPEVRRRILLGTFALSEGHAEAWHRQATQVRRLVRDELTALFEDVDLLAGPTSPVPAFQLGERSGDPRALAACDTLTAPACLAGLPSVSVPCGLVRRGGAKGMPVGLCLTGPVGADHRVLAAARAFEAARGEPERSPLFEDER